MIMNTLLLKILCLFILFCLTLCLGVIPIKLIGGDRSRRESRWREVAVAFCSCFAGGVFLATCLLGLIPDVRDTLIEISSIGGFGLDSDYPNTEILVGTGFFLVLFVEQAILSSQNTNSKKTIRLTEMGIRPREEAEQSPTEFDHEDVSDTSRESRAFLFSPFDDIREQRNNNHSHRTTETKFRSYVLLVALSVHSLFEGLALGLAEDEGHILQLLYALVAHKSVLSFSLGSSLVMSNMTTSQVIKACVLFSVMCPLGISIGTAVMESASKYSSHLAAGVLQGLAAGTFMYVTFFEVMAPEFNRGSDDHRLWKVLFIVLGFGSVAVAHLFHAHAFGSLHEKEDKCLCGVNGTTNGL